MKTRRKRICLVIGILLALYCLGYVGARLNHHIVHYISCDASGVYIWHDVADAHGYEVTDTGAIMNARIAAFYTPLRKLELGWWHLARPLGSPLTDAQKRSFGLLPATNSAQPVAWEQAVEMIKGGQVATVLQTHSLYVGLCTTSGIWYHTSEPRIDEVFRITRQHAPNKIREITE